MSTSTHEEAPDAGEESPAQVNRTLDYPRESPVSPEKQFEMVASKMSTEEKMNFLMKTTLKARSEAIGTPAEGGDRTGSGLGVNDLVRGLSAGLADFAKSVNFKNGELKLDRIKRSDAQDFYEICHWLMRAEQEPDVQSRIRTALVKGSEIMEMAKVSKAIKSCRLAGEERWAEFVKLVCNAVRPGFLSDVPSDINEPERFSTAGEAKRAVSKRFEAFAWLASMFTEMKDAAGVGDLAKASMLMRSLPEDMEAAVDDSMDVLEAHQKTFLKVSQLIAKKSKRKRERGDTSEGIVMKSPAKRVMQRIGKPTRTIWAANAVREDGDSVQDQCQLCGEVGHTALSCNNVQVSANAQQQPARPPVTCYNCGEQGHISRECPRPQRPKGRAQTSSGQRCYNCGQIGHISVNCPARQGVQPVRQDSRLCYTCQQPGHISRNCPNRNVTPPGPPNYPPPGFLSQSPLNN